MSAPAQTAVPWQQVAPLAEGLLACGRAPEAFRMALLYRLGWGGEGAAEFLHSRFRAAPLRLTVVMDEGIGNMVMLTPALRALKDMFPLAGIEVVGRPPALQVLERWPAVARRTALTAFAADAQRDGLLLSAWSDGFGRAFGPWLKRWDGPVVRARLDGTERHESEVNMDLARALGWRGPAPAPYSAVEDVESPFAPGRPVVLLADTTNPDPAWTRKRWPHFPALAEALLAEGRQVGLVGGRGEAERFEPDGWPPGVVNLLGAHSLPQTASLIRQADCLVANDSGPAHVAGAVGAFTVVLFGATREAKNRPLGPRVCVLTDDVDCRPCQYTPRWPACDSFRCMDGISVARVMACIREGIADGV